jgi:probable HAF family extracellular repeat protein
MRFLAPFILLGAWSLSAATYTVQDLGLLPGYELSRGTDLNNRGQVVGWLETSNDVSRAFLWEGGAMKLLGDPGWLESLASSINNRGEIVGAMRTGGARHSFRLTKGGYLDLGEIDRFSRLGMPGSFVAGGSINDNSHVVTRLTIPDGDQRTALLSGGEASFFGLLADGRICHGLAMNNHDHIAGQVFDSNRHSKPFLWRNGEFVDLGSLGGTRASATEINDSGTVIGWALPTDAGLRGAHAFVWNENGGIRDLGTLGGRSSRAYGLNNRGRIVGYSQRTEGDYGAFLWEDGRLRDLNTMLGTGGWNVISAGAINDRGQILASAVPPDGGKRRAVLLSPNDLVSVAELVIAPPDRRGRSVGAAGPAFNLTSFERLADGSFRLGFAGLPGREYAVEVSPTLQSWTRLEIAKNDAGAITFIDRRAARSRLCFYRVVLQPAAVPGSVD